MHPWEHMAKHHTRNVWPLSSINKYGNIATKFVCDHTKQTQQTIKHNKVQTTAQRGKGIGILKMHDRHEKSALYEVSLSKYVFLLPASDPVSRQQKNVLRANWLSGLNLILKRKEVEELWG